MDAGVQYVPLSQGFETLFRRLEREALKAYRETVDVELRAYAMQFRRDLVTSVEQQRDPLEPLSPRWLAKKKRHGLDQRVLIASNEMLRNVRVAPLPRGAPLDGFVIEPTRVRVKPYKFQKGHSTLTYWDLWSLHESGTDRMPARPVWSFAAKRVASRMSIIKRDIARAYERRLRRRMQRFIQR